MKYFLLRILFFVVPLILLFIGIEFFSRKTPNAYRFKYEWMDKNSQNVEGLIFGSSHSFYGINPQYLKGKCFNLANVSQTLFYDDYLLSEYIDKCPKLSFIILPISSFSLYGKLENGSEWYRAIYYKLYMGCNYHEDLSKYSFEISAIKNAKGKVLALLQNKDIIKCNAFGYGTEYTLKNKGRNWDEGYLSAKRHTADASKLRYIKANESYLNHIAKLCHERNIRLLLITAPARPSYFNNLDKTQMEQIASTIKRIEDKFDNVNYYNYLKDIRFKSNDFFDADHLSDQGAKKLSLILQDIVSN